MKRMVYCIIMLVLLVIAFALGGIVTEKHINEKLVERSEEETKKELPGMTETDVEEDEVSIPEEIDESTGPVSIYSWYFELTNQSQFHQLAEPLKQMGITRIYQLMSAERVEEPETLIMLNRLKKLGIETVFLTGSAVWVEDGAAEYEMIIDSIVRFNQRTVPELQIHAVAIDVEAHTLPEWKQDSLTVFKAYVELMRHLKEYANANGIRVIQVIPTSYDNVDKELFDVFLKECCDEISIMNYNRKSAHTDIVYEVEKAKEYGIPVETILETMPLSEEHFVTSDMTYYYEGVEVLQNDVLRLKAAYGNELGIAYHHYATLYEMCRGEVFGEISLFAKYLKEDANPGNVMLKGEDGSILLATPYWPQNKKEKNALSWLVTGVKENIRYTATYFELYSNERFVEEVVFIPGENGKLQAVLREGSEMP